VLADVERVDPDRNGEDGLLDRVADDDVTAERLAGLVDGDEDGRIQSELDLLGGHRSLLSTRRRPGACVHHQPSSWAVRWRKATA
jgi:hypothetical protein